MKRSRQSWRIPRVAFVMALLLGVFLTHSASAEAAWPQRIVSGSTVYTLYEPRIEAYEDGWMTAQSALSVKEGSQEPVFGAAWYKMRVEADEKARTAWVSAFAMKRLTFTEDGADDVDVIEDLLGNHLTGQKLPLDPLLDSLAREQAALAAAEAGSDAVPEIVFAPYPIVIVEVDGPAEMVELRGTDLLKVLNTEPFIVMKKSTGRWFMLLDEDYWLTADSLEGEWQETGIVPPEVAEAADRHGLIVETGQSGKPRVRVTTRPTEVIQTDGVPKYTPIRGTDLLYIMNTDVDVFLDIGSQRHFVLLAGRWFSAPSLRSGVWEAVAPEALPETFLQIPPSSPKFGVLVHVPGTDVARQAALDAAVPRTRAVSRTGKRTVVVEYEGDPEFVRVEDTKVYYAVNTPRSVLRVSNRYYLCTDGVWYWGASAVGPWDVCVTVPSVIYTIPPASPVYPVTYVRVYDVTPSTVYVGYTSGYLGWHTSWHLSGVVFGFAYYDYDWHHRRHYRRHWRRSHSWHYPRYRGYHYYRRHDRYRSGRDYYTGGHHRPGPDPDRRPHRLAGRSFGRRDYHRYTGSKPPRSMHSDAVPQFTARSGKESRLGSRDDTPNYRVDHNSQSRFGTDPSRADSLPGRSRGGEGQERRKPLVVQPSSESSVPDKKRGFGSVSSDDPGDSIRRSNSPAAVRNQSDRESSSQGRVRLQKPAGNGSRSYRSGSSSDSAERAVPNYRVKPSAREPSGKPQTQSRSLRVQRSSRGVEDTAEEQSDSSAGNVRSSKSLIIRSPSRSTRSNDSGSLGGSSSRSSRSSSLIVRPGSSSSSSRRSTSKQLDSSISRSSRDPSRSSSVQRSSSGSPVDRSFRSSSIERNRPSILPQSSQSRAQSQSRSLTVRPGSSSDSTRRSSSPKQLKPSIMSRSSAPPKTFSSGSRGSSSSSSSSSRSSGRNSSTIRKSQSDGGLRPQKFLRKGY